MASEIIPAADNYTKEALAVEVDQNLKEEKKKGYPVLIATGRTAPAEFARSGMEEIAISGGVLQDRAG